MFLSLKYHIASLVAVFLALGLGILIGGAVLGGDTLFRQQQQELLGRLESRMESVKQKNESLRARIDQLETESSINGQFGKQILPAVVGGKLHGHNLAVIATAGSANLAGELANILKMAGASVQNITVIDRSRIHPGQAALNNLGWQETDENGFMAAVAREISLAIVNGDTRVLKILAGHGVLKIGGQYGKPVSDLVIIGGGTDKNTTASIVDIHIIDFFKSKGISVYGAEESSSANYCIREYQKKGLATVDNIETVPGQVSLVYAISGRPGHYGVKPTAKSLLPILEYGVEVNAR